VFLLTFHPLLFVVIFKVAKIIIDAGYIRILIYSEDFKKLAEIYDKDVDKKGGRYLIRARNIYRDNIYNNIEILQISNCLKIFNKYPIFWDKKSKKIVLSFDLDRKNNQIYYLLEDLSPIAKQTNLLLKSYQNRNFRRRREVESLDAKLVV
jgi:hypothetical protein